MSLPSYPTYKDSGVAWLGQVPGHWRVDRFKASIDSCKNGIWGDEPSGDGNDIACVRVADFDRVRLGVKEHIPTLRNVSDKERVGRLLTRGDLLLEKSGGGELQPVGQVVMYDLEAPAVCSNFIAKLSLARDMVPAYWNYVHSAAYSVRLNIGAINQTSGIQNLDQDRYFNERAPFPPSGEQAAIATFLDRETSKIDALIVEQEKLLALLAEKRQATVSHAVTRGVNPNAPMKDSGVAWLGEVPVHWTVVPLKRLLSDVKAGPFGSALTKDMYVSSGYRVYGQEQVIPADFSIGDYYISDSKFAELQQYSVKAGDILISCVGTFGKIAIVPEHVEPGIINPRLIRLRVGATMLGRYLEAVLRSSVVFEQFSMVSRGGTMDVINIGTLNAVTLAIPPTHEQEDLLVFLDVETAKLDKLKSEAERAIALLAERRRALIAAAVTGKIDVRNAVPQELAA